MRICNSDETDDCDMMCNDCDWSGPESELDTGPDVPYCPICGSDSVEPSEQRNY